MSEPLDLEQSLLPWLEASWRRLLSQAAQERFPHALLLSGPAGVGKRCFAAKLAAWWLCMNPQPEGGCGNCQSCHLLATGGHPDICFPQQSGKSEQLRVDEIRDLVVFCNKTAQFGGRRLVLLQPAGHMNISAQNALLKTLEEPGDSTLLLLVADRPQRLLATVRSRCQQFALVAPDHAQSCRWLESRGLDGATAEAALAAAGGAPLLAETLAESDWFQQRGTLIEQLLALAEGRTSLVTVTRALARFPREQLLVSLANWCHQALRSGFLSQPVTDPAMRGMLTLIKKRGARVISHWYDSLQTAVAGMERSANLNPELLLDQLLWQLTPDGAASSLGRGRIRM